MIIAIDGPSGSGKSSVSKAVARALGVGYLDTGAMYRALTWWCLERGIDLTDRVAVARAARDMPLAQGTDPDHPTVTVAARDIGEEIRTTRVSTAVSAVATNLLVRPVMRERQRDAMAAVEQATGGVVVEGRDITTVVAPDADVRILLTASEGARLARRSLELHGEAGEHAVAATRDQIVRRDRDDSTVSHFTTAADGVTTVDTSDLDFDGSVAAVLAVVGDRTRGGGPVASPSERLTTLLHDLDAGLGDRRPDLRDPGTLAAARSMAGRLLGVTNDPAALSSLEQVSTAAGSGLARLTQLAVKLARSRALLLRHTPALQVTLVVPAYGENIRLLPRGTGPGQHPDGEGFVVEKGLQLTWLFDGTPHAYELLVVDDQSKPDPESSGAAIARVAAEERVPHVRVVFLEEGIRTEKSGSGLVATSLRGVDIPKNTRKAGAVYYGFAKAVQAHGAGPDHVVVLTDCDLSVDVGQVGNLVAPIVKEQAVAAAGSRRLPESVLEIEPGRNTRANAARYFREILLAGLLPLDTQCGAKAFAASAVADVVGAGMEVLDFSFDIELLTRLALRFGPDRIVPVSVAWFDSSELTTTDSSVHFGIMAAQLRIALANQTGSGPVFDETVALARRLTSDEGLWLRFLDRLADRPDLLRAVEAFDRSALPALDDLADAAMV